MRHLFFILSICFFAFLQTGYTQIITSIAGGGATLGDGGPAILAKTSGPAGGCF